MSKGSKTFIFKTQAGETLKIQRKNQEEAIKRNTENWKRYLVKIRDREWTDAQIKCSQHSFERVPKSGALLGISLYRCIYCEAVTQST